MDNTVNSGGRAAALEKDPSECPFGLVFGRCFLNSWMLVGSNPSCSLNCLMWTLGLIPEPSSSEGVISTRDGGFPIEDCDSFFHFQMLSYPASVGEQRIRVVA